jgi:hypothetical protein
MVGCAAEEYRPQADADVGSDQERILLNKGLGAGCGGFRVFEFWGRL